LNPTGKILRKLTSTSNDQLPHTDEIFNPTWAPLF
jgi:hypothetical protein